MKTLITVLLTVALCFVAFLALAQANKKPDTKSNIGDQLPRYEFCTKKEDLFRSAYSKYGETPIFGGNQKNGAVTVILLNKREETWTLVEILGETACVIAVGKGAQFIQMNDIV